MENSPKNTIIDVIPLTRLPLNRQQSFSYLHSEKVPFGSLLSIPLFHREVQGIAIGNRDDFFRFGNIKLRKINKVLDENFLTEKQLKLAEFISEYYICPLGIVLKFFAVKKTKSKNVERETANVEHKELKLSKEQRIIFNKILKSDKTLLISGKEKIEIYLELIKKNIQKDKQALLLLPEIPLLYQALDIVKEHFDENLIVLFHSRLKGSELYHSYQKIKSGEARIILGTRQAVFAPFANLGLIIVDEEQDVSYKQWDMNPRYNARDAAHKLAEIHNAEIILQSPAPSLESYYKITNLKDYCHSGLDPESTLAIASSTDSCFRRNDRKNSKLQIQNKTQNDIEIIDLRKEGWNKNGKRRKDILLGKKLVSEIGFALKYGQQVFLFAGKRGMSSFSVCASCKEVLRCPRCERALIYDKDGHYRCLHCAYKTDIFAKCPKCNGTEFRNIGIGNQTIEREIKKIFPGAKTKLIDFESLKNKEDQKKLFSEINSGKFDIIIGTQTILKAWDLPKIGLISIINADDLLSFSEYNSDERAFQILSEALQKASDTKETKLIIQTYNTEHPVIKSIGESGFEKFYENELEQRKSLQYPPFCKMIKLTLRTFYQAKIEKESAFIFGRMKILSEKNSDISVFEPFIPQLSKIRDKFRKQIVIKLRCQEIPEELERTLKNLGSEWIIDVDPISIN